MLATSPSAPLFIRVRESNGETRTVPRNSYSSSQLGKMKRNSLGVYILPTQFESSSSQTDARSVRSVGSQKDLAANHLLTKVVLSDFHPLECQKQLDGRSQLIVRNAFDGLSRMKVAFDDNSGIFSNTAKLVAALLGISERTVHRIASKTDDEIMSEIGKKREPSTRKSMQDAALNGLPEGIAEELAAKIPEWWASETHITLSSVKEWILDEFAIDVSVSTIGRCLHALGFSHRISTYNPLVNGRDEIVRWRENYVSKIIELREQGHDFYYHDESWVHSGFNSKYGWNSTKANPYFYAERSAVENFIPGPTAQVTKGSRAIVMATLGIDGILPGSVDVVISGVKPDDQYLDYHRECNAELFEEHMTRVIPLLAQNAANKGKRAVLILDNASYHSRALNQLPNAKSRKPELQQFLRSKGITVGDQLLPELRSMTKMCIQQLGGRRALTLYWLEDFAAKHGVIIMRLPPYHCHLNAIEFVWHQLKQHLRSVGRSTDKLPLVRERTLAWMRDYSAESAAATIDHIVATELAIAQELADRDDLAQQVVNVLSDAEDSDGGDSTA